MSKAIEFHVREKIVADCQSGLSYSKVAVKYSVRYNTVKMLHKRFLKLGTKGLIPNYQNCGKYLPGPDNLIFRATCWLKRLHPEWGAPFILVKLKDKYPEAELPTARTAQRWFRTKGLNKLRTKIPKPKGGWAKNVHDVWQIDAKEQIVLADSSSGCWLTIVDEKSGATLAALVFPPQSDFTSPGTKRKAKA